VVAAISLMAVATRRFDLLGFLMLLRQAVGAVVGQRIGSLGLGLELHGTVLQAGQAGLQVRLLTEHRHFQLGLHAAAVGVHAGDQRIAGGLPRQLQQALEASLLPMQSGQAEWNGEQRGQREAHGVIEPGADEKADLADQDER